MTSTLILNGILAAPVFTLILGLVRWAIHTAHHDGATHHAPPVLRVADSPGAAAGLMRLAA